MLYESGLIPEWSADQAPRAAWPNGARMAFWLAPNIEYYELDPPKNPLRSAWPRPTPDFQNWSWRDYGNRVGVWRCLEVFDKHGLKGSVSLNSAMCAAMPGVVQAFVDRGWELFSHGQFNTQYLLGMDAETERAHLAASCEQISAFSGQPVRGLLSPALTYTATTLENAAACGIDYVLDICASDSALALKLPGRQRMLAIPYSLELNDFFAVVAGGLSARAYVERFKLQFDQLLVESDKHPRIVGLPLHPYLIGMPQYIWALDEMLTHVRAHPEIWCTRAVDIVDCVWQSMPEAA